MAQGDTNNAKREAQEAYDKALLLRNMTQGASNMFSDLLRRMEDFQNNRGGARPAEIRAVSIFCLVFYSYVYSCIYIQQMPRQFLHDANWLSK